MYAGSDNGLTDTYMMPGSVPGPHITLLQPPEGVEYMTAAVGPEIVYDQELYYPPANGYGYFSTGFGTQSEWDDHHNFFGLDGQELHYSALQTEHTPYVYYSPSYAYEQPSYNPYNPYIPGAVTGLDGPTIGTQQYISDPSYQFPISSPTAYVPVVIQPNSDAISNVSVASSLYGTVGSVPGGHASGGSKYSHSRASSNGRTTSEGAASRIMNSESSRTGSSEATGRVSANGKQSSSLGTVTSGIINQMNQGRTSSLVQQTDHFSLEAVSSVQSPSKVSSSNRFPNFGSAYHGYTAVDRFRPRFHFSGLVKSGNGNPDILGEQNRGPRTNKSKGQWSSAVSGGAQVNKVGADNTKEAIIIGADKYNRDDLPVDYPDAKFFVIKSYSEDDVHKSIKYNVWSSTPNGNKRLDSAFGDAQKPSAGKPRKCPVFLFFSVNASGQFCGVAEMVGHVDFDKDMDFWQQDKWTGSFPVKWHIIKDVPNTSFRHILLENNENKPVTNSRDTQEITYTHGMDMLNIFKGSPLKTSILDDFMFYEERQKIMQQEKSRFSGRSYNTYIPAIVSSSKSNDNSCLHNSAGQTAADGERRSDQTTEADGKQVADTLQLVEDATTPNLAHRKDDSIDQHFTMQDVAAEQSDDEKGGGSAQTGEAEVGFSITKMKSLSVGSKEIDNKPNIVKELTGTDMVTVGSLPIKVNGTVQPASTLMTIGSVPVEPKAMTPEAEGASSNDNKSQ